MKVQGTTKKRRAKNKNEKGKNKNEKVGFLFQKNLNFFRFFELKNKEQNYEMKSKTSLHQLKAVIQKNKEKIWLRLLKLKLHKRDWTDTETNDVKEYKDGNNKEHQNKGEKL